MATQLKEETIFDLSGGLITEASPLAFPKNATKDEQNFVITSENARARRLGLDYETGAEAEALGFTFSEGDAYGVYKWNAVNDDGSVTFDVVQIADRIWFYEDTHPLSDNRRGFTVNLSNHKVDAGQDPALYRVQVAAIDGALVIVSPVIHPIVVTYDLSDETINVRNYKIYVRDVLGVDDELDVETRPTTLTEEHQYNLLNQGWPQELIDETFTDQGFYPSNSMISFLAKVPDPTTNIREFSSDQLLEELFGRVHAPRGKFIIDYFDTSEGITDPVAGTTYIIDSWTYNHGAGTVTLTLDQVHAFVVSDEVRISGNNYNYFTTGPTETIHGSLNGDHTITAVPDTNKITFSYTIGNFSSFVNQGNGEAREVTGGTGIVTRPGGEAILTRPNATYSYAGRIWYAFRNTVFFSQIVDDLEQLGYCYSIADPTSEHISSPSDADGGFIKIPNVSTVVGFSELGPFLILLCTNGVWQIGGGPDAQGSFRPTDFFVRKLSSVSCTSPASIISVEGNIFFAGSDGFYRIAFDDNGFPRVDNVIKPTIQSRYQGITSQNKRNIQCTYDFAEKLLYVAYGEGGNQFDPPTKALVLNDKKNAWTVYSFPDSAELPRLLGITTLSEPTDAEYHFKALVLTPDDEVVWCEFNNKSFLDFEKFDGDGQDAKAYLIMGYDLLGLGSVWKQAPVIETYMKRTETFVLPTLEYDFPSGCLITPLWDFNDSEDSGKIPSSEQIYKFERAFTVGTTPYSVSFLPNIITTKTTLRGSGRAVQLKFESEPNKDCILYGWSIVKQVPTKK